MLMFGRGDNKSIELMMNTFRKFSNSIGLKVNSSKCKVYFGGLDKKEKDIIQKMTRFSDGTFSFRYPGVLLTSKKLVSHHYMSQVDNVVAKISHWSTKIISYAGRIQVIKIVTFAITSYWMRSFPIPKQVIHKQKHYVDLLCGQMEKK